MDPRYANTAARLSEAVLRLSGEHPVEQLTASELARAAEVTRRTLYNHASGPEQLLQLALRPDLDIVRDNFFGRIETGMPIGEAWAIGDQDVANFVVKHLKIFRAGLHDGHLSPTLAHMVIDSMEDGTLRVITEKHPNLDAPMLTARFVGHGIVGAIEAWLISEEQDPEKLAKALLQSIPDWLLES